MKQQISTASAPGAIGPYSQAIQSGDFVFCSGQIGIDPTSGRLVEGGVEHETRRALENLREVLGAAGLRFSDIVKTTIYVVDLGDFDLVNRIYGEHLSPPYPARSTVQAAALPRGARVEIEAIAQRQGQ
jgi:2-iminobutanoate/2-iminopropanoate deaminase